MNGLELIKHFEGLRLESYLCPAGKLTIGYGHTGNDVKPNMKITEIQADKLLADDFLEAESDVAKLVKVPLNENQLDALASFVFNLGSSNLWASTLLKKLNAGDYEGAAREFDRWVYTKNPKTGKPEVLNGLVKRRAAERQLFERKPNAS